MASNFIIVTGMPACGKTTIIKNIVNELKKAGIPKINGFYTEESRNSSGVRIGFDINIINDNVSDSKKILARDSTVSSTNRVLESNHRVGKYRVYLEEFEECMSCLSEDENSLLVIDEIGKMELFSDKFRKLIQNFITSKSNLKILATVPLKSADSLITQLKSHKNSKLFHITKSNRDEMYTEILNKVKEML